MIVFRPAAMNASRSVGDASICTVFASPLMRAGKSSIVCPFSRAANDQNVATTANAATPKRITRPRARESAAAAPTAKKISS
jgi:hypothetical protein